MRGGLSGEGWLLPRSQLEKAVEDPGSSERALGGQSWSSSSGNTSLCRNHGGGSRLGRRFVGVGRWGIDGRLDG